MYCYESKANYDALVQVRRINANFRSIHVEGAGMKNYKLSEDDDVGLGTITDYEVCETPTQKQAREKRADDEKKGTVKELMEQRKQQLAGGDEWKTSMRRENAPATYPVSDDADLAAHPERAKARRRGYMAMRISQSYFRCVIAIPVKPTKSMPLTSEGIEGGDPNEQPETPQRRQTRSQMKPMAEDNPKPAAKVGFAKPEQELNVLTSDDKTNTPPDDPEKTKSARKRPADGILPGPRKRKPPQYHKQQIEAAVKGLSSENVNSTGETAGTWVTAPRPNEPEVHPNTFLAWAGDVAYLWPYEEDLEHRLLIAPLRIVSTQAVGKLCARGKQLSKVKAYFELQLPVQSDETLPRCVGTSTDRDQYLPALFQTMHTQRTLELRISQ